MHWRERALAEYASSPQRAVRVRHALQALDEAIQALASLGFPLHLEEGLEVSNPQEWPKMVFHLRCEPRVVACQAELDELGPDWFPSLDEAKQSAGMAKQWQRGGIFTKSLPAPLSLMPQPEVAPHQSSVVALEERQKRRLNGRGPVEMPGTKV